MQIADVIEEAIDLCEKKITWTEIAETAGLTKSALSHWKSGAEINFLSLLNISKLISNILKKDTLKDFCLGLNKPKNLKYALEYLALNSYTSELKQLINNIRKEHTNRELLDLVDAYEVMLNFLISDNTDEILHQIRSYYPKTLEAKVLLLFIEIYCHFYNREYKTMMSLSKGLRKTIFNIKDNFLKKCFSLRLDEIEANVYLYYYNDPVKAREFGFRIINSDLGLNFISHSYYLVGMSFLFEDYNQCISHLNAYKEICEKLGDAVDRIENDIHFVNNVWKKYNNSPRTKDISEIAHYEALEGNREVALKLIEESISKEGVTGFKLYYKALATNDLSHFMQSLIYFVKSGNKYFARLPYSYLAADPTYKQMADMLLEN